MVTAEQHALEERREIIIYNYIQALERLAPHRMPRAGGDRSATSSPTPTPSATPAPSPIIDPLPPLDPAPASTSTSSVPADGQGEESVTPVEDDDLFGDGDSDDAMDGLGGDAGGDGEDGLGDDVGDDDDDELAGDETGE
jgi:hypothetical protein